jgi:myosin heavy subunit
MICHAKVGERGPLDRAAGLLRVGVGQLDTALTSRQMQGKSSTITVPLRPPQAADTRDALAKARR